MIVLLHAMPARADEAPSSEPTRQWKVESERPPKLETETAPKDHYMLAERPLRLGLEILVGGIAAGAVGGAFVLVGTGLCNGTGLGHDAEDDCFAPGVYSGAAGLMLGIPIGVYLGGELLKGDGALGWTFAAGSVLSGLGLAATAATNSPEVLAVSIVGVLAGSILAYELTSDSNIATARATSGGSLNLSPFVDWTRAGISVFGVF